jgi:hypothetical protein
VRFWASHEYVNRLWRMHCIIDIKKCHKSVYMCIKHAPIDSSVWSEEKKHWNRNDSNWCLFMYLTKCKIQIATFFWEKGESYIDYSRNMLHSFAIRHSTHRGTCTCHIVECDVCFVNCASSWAILFCSQLIYWNLTSRML